MARAMKQLGISTEEIEGVDEVVIRTRTKDIVIRPAEVSVMIQQGERTWQVNGTATERPKSAGAPSTPSSKTPAPASVPPADAPLFTEADVKLVMEQAGVDEKAATAALRDAGGEPAAAIVKLIEG